MPEGLGVVYLGMALPTAKDFAAAHHFSDAITQLLVDQLMHACECGYLMVNFRRDGMLKSRTSRVDPNEVAYRITQLGSGHRQNLAGQIEVFLQRAVSIATENRILLDALRTADAALAAQLGPHVDEWSEKMRSAYAWGMLSAQVDGSEKDSELRILMLGASPKGDLRITREHSRIRDEIDIAKHRDRVDIDVRLSATTRDLQRSIARFRPHVVHFSGHGDEKLITFERDLNPVHTGVVVTAEAFSAACKATDFPPRLIVLNSCNSASTAKDLVATVAPLGIGMNKVTEDDDSIEYAAALYSSLANGQSVHSAHQAGKAAIGLADGQHSSPYLAASDGIDPASVFLV
jgi:hypothetical protein